MQIRKMTTDDLDQVAELEEKNFSVPWHKESFAEILNNPAALYMVAEQDGKLIGTCGIITALDEGDICNVVTDENFRGQGVAYALVSKVMERAFEEFGTTNFTLEVRVGNASAIVPPPPSSTLPSSPICQKTFALSIISMTLAIVSALASEAPDLPRAPVYFVSTTP